MKELAAVFSREETVRFPMKNFPWEISTKIGNFSRHLLGNSLALCSDITNTLVGISGETVPEGGNLRIY